MNIVITGVTGLLGRNFLFELLKRNIDDLSNLNIYLLGRSFQGVSFKERIYRIIDEDGVKYLDLEASSIKVNKIKDLLFCCELDLDQQDFITETEIGRIFNKKIDKFFHIASLTDFRSTSGVIRALEKTNVLGTERLLEIIAKFSLKEFCYVGSAYSCGKKEGLIAPDYIDVKQDFRNPYEKTKLLAEIKVREFCKQKNIKCKVFRPSTICGRLMENPLGSVNKFDVFYSWAAFFLRQKIKIVGEDKKYEKKVNFPVRVSYNSSAGLNIVPADFCAKAMYEISFSNIEEESFYLVNQNETPHDLYINIMLKSIGVMGVNLVDDSVVDNLTSLEKLYYKTVGNVFTPYISSGSMLFDTSNMDDFLKSKNIQCPHVDDKNFNILMDFAKKCNFGLS